MNGLVKTLSDFLPHSTERTTRTTLQNLIALDVWDGGPRLERKDGAERGIGHHRKLDHGRGVLRSPVVAQPPLVLVTGGLGLS